MLRQIRYFHSVIRNNSFSEAAEECHISQSAISQQIQALEFDLGFKLLQRNHKKFSLTPAGKYFYQKTLILVADYDRICLEANKIASGNTAFLRIGYLRNYTSNEMQQSLAIFAEKYPDVSLHITQGNHEELYTLLRKGQIDIALNDQRRAFSDEYFNLILTSIGICIEISNKSPLAALDKITPQELKNTPCILVSSIKQQAIEAEYYQNILGIKSEFIYAENIETARLLVTSGKGFMPIENLCSIATPTIIRIPLIRNHEQITKNYCAFWRKDNANSHLKEFANILKAQFK